MARVGKYRSDRQEGVILADPIRRDSRCCSDYGEGEDRERVYQVVYVADGPGEVRAAKNRRGGRRRRLWPQPGCFFLYESHITSNTGIDVWKIIGGYNEDPDRDRRRGAQVLS